MPPLFILTLKFRLQGCSSLKEKRSRMASFLAKLKKENISVIESDFLNQHQESEITIAKLSINNSALNRDLDQLLAFIDYHRGDIELYDYQVERYN
ncbi:MAG TPA: DUF503 domain-containing protein [Anaerolineaceae bacterium]|nr:DUF503 domain-containing protein [Anaerolineaceae bacterium]